MKTVILLTKESLHLDNTGDILKKVLADYRTACSTETLWFSKPGDSLCVEFSPEDKMSDPLSGYNEDEKSKVGFDAHLTNITYHRFDTLAKLLNALDEYFPGLLVDDDDGNIDTVKNFLNS